MDKVPFDMYNSKHKRKQLLLYESIKPEAGFLVYLRYSFENRPYKAKRNDARAETTLRVSYPSKGRLWILPVQDCTVYTCSLLYIVRNKN
jgi:hypothetical protein